jgi:hypothetical protein
MTTLEIILLAVVWISYGAFSHYQYLEDFEDAKAVFWMIVLAPFVLLIRIIIGVFAKKTMQD